jgi:hypothetical protein
MSTVGLLVRSWAELEELIGNPLSVRFGDSVPSFDPLKVIAVSQSNRQNQVPPYSGFVP